MLAFSPEALADPDAVIVAAVCDADPAVDQDAIAEIVAAVAPGRSTRRRLAQTLLDRPSLLADGCSPAPRVAGDFLVALIKLGVSVSPPRCANCSKHLATFHRRGQDWYCGVCGPTPLACAVCGRVRKVAARDRAGHPRCGSCLPDDGGRPIDAIAGVVATVDPTLDPDTVRSAVERVTSRAGQRRQLGWALQDRPELLTGAGAESPTPAVLRLIDALREAGSTSIVRPSCPHCGRIVVLSKLRDGLRICRGCEARRRAVPCARCGAVRDPVTRDDLGRPICPNCFMRDPANREVCVRCERRRPVSVRVSDGPVCPSCRPVKEMTCSICGRFAPAEISKATGQPWCRACQKRWARCAGCGQSRPVRGGNIDRPLCASCTQPDPLFWKRCPTCAEATKLTDGRCVRCDLRRRLTDLLAGPDGAIRPQLQALFHNLAEAELPATALSWIKHEHTTTILGGLGRGDLPLAHDTLDRLPAAKTVEHLRAVLVATGALPARDEHMARLERWVADAIAARPDPDERYLLKRYAVWHLLRRLRRRRNGAPVTYNQTTTVKARLRVAVELLDWLAARGLTLGSADQSHLDDWLAGEGATRQGDAGNFVRWAASQKLTRMGLPAIRWNGPTASLDADKRWEQARWLLRDNTLEAADRVAGLLVLLYAQKVAAISRLTLDHVEYAGPTISLRLGPRPVALPEPLTVLILDLVASRRGHAAVGNPPTSPWLFPGGQPGRPISASRLSERLRDLGIHPGAARSSALMQLATELPAAVIARMLGMHIKVAVEWQRAASGDWTAYAADYSRRADGTAKNTSIQRSTNVDSRDAIT
jgi:hypothetical protein